MRLKIHSYKVQRASTWMAWHYNQGDAKLENHWTKLAVSLNKMRSTLA